MYWLFDNFQNKTDFTFHQIYSQADLHFTKNSDLFLIIRVNIYFKKSEIYLYEHVLRYEVFTILE